MTTLTMPQPFGGVLRTWRKRRGVTQQQLADLSTVSVRAIRDLEIGRVARPRQDTVRLICDALGLTGRARADFHAAASDADPAWPHEAFASPPVVYDTIVGRETELAELKAALNGGERLIALVGLAGVGKTRLAIEAAAAQPRPPVLWSTLSTCDGREDTVVRLIRTALSFGGSASVGACDQLSALIRDRDTVLVCDGYDAIDTGPVASLLKVCHGLRILVTSRTPIRADGVRLIPVAPLEAPAATQLLLRHARRERPGFELAAGHAAAICEAFDGLPAALIAAASWLPFYEPATLLHQTATIARDTLQHIRSVLPRLSGEERALLDAVAQLPGAFTAGGAAGAFGGPPEQAAHIMRNLRMLGLLRPLSGYTFALPHLVKAAALLPGQPPMSDASRP
jgi:transcriptional regulator with XRE-family HTH domain